MYTWCTTDYGGQYLWSASWWLPTESTKSCCRTAVAHGITSRGTATYFTAWYDKKVWCEQKSWLW